jgi:hypothetical protein
MSIPMSYGYAAGSRFGFASFSDWLDSIVLSFPAPWSVRPLNGKYYGTKIADARGVEIFSFWDAGSEPSARQLGTMSEEEWRKHRCDSHWESQSSLDMAEEAVAIRNQYFEGLAYEVPPAALVFTLLRHARLENQAANELSHGTAPGRRMTYDERLGKEKA